MQILTPSKFYYGTSILWRGINLRITNKFLLFLIKKSVLKKLFLNYRSYRSEKRNSENNSYLFNSARSAIAFSLLSLNIGEGDEVIVNSFTCDALDYAVSITKAKPIYIDIEEDLKMNYIQLKSKINKKTKAVIIQNTFGKLGLSPENIESLNAKGILTIVDDSLSYGSKLKGIPLSQFGDISVCSFECTKTITLGGGGILRLNNQKLKDRINSKYLTLNRTDLLEDIRKFMQLWFSLFFQQYPSIFGPFIWFLFKVIGIIKGSADQNKKDLSSIERMGYFGEELFNYIAPTFNNVFRKTRRNNIYLQLISNDLNIKVPVEKSCFEEIVSPRFSILVKPNKIKDVLNLASKRRIEIGRWFDKCPPSKNIFDIDYCDFEITSLICLNIINFPCYWTLSKEELRRIKDLIIELYAKDLLQTNKNF
tara:strand:+ start:4773 stop:6041 length:1269 start_codon:yes stop_codon:yes gene_type:complete